MQDSRNRKDYPKDSWLSNMIVFPQLESDTFIILDCFVESLSGSDDPKNISFLADDDNSWARYLVLFAGYSNSSTVPGKLSKELMTLLEELATSGRFYAREGLIRSWTLQQKLEMNVRFDNDLNLRWFGNQSKDFIHVSPLHTSNIP